jgi:hypothetical protein
MKRFLASAVLLVLMGSFSACAHHGHEGHAKDQMSCGSGDAKCEDCAKGHCKVDMADKGKTSDKCDGHCDTKDAK